MSKMIKSKIEGMSRKAKAGLVSLCTLLLMIGIFQTWWHDVDAAIVNSQVWSSVYSGTAFPGSYTYTVPGGSDRLLVVAVQSTITAAATQTCTVTWGGKALTNATDNGSTSAQAHSFLFYLKEADIAAASGSSLAVTVTGGTTSYNMVRAAVYTGVDQSTPVTMTATFISATAVTTVGPLSPNLTIPAGGQAIQMINLSRTGNATSRTITVTSPWSTLFASATGTGTGTIGVRNYLFGDTTAAPNITGQWTASGSTLAAMSAMVIQPKTSTTLTVSTNTPLASGTSLDTATGVVMQRVQVTGSGALEINSLTLHDLGTTSVLANAQIYISPTFQTSLPNDAVLLASQTGWTGASTPFSLTGGTTANRTLGGTEPLTKYIYILYDFSSGTASKTAQSSITAIGVASPNIGATGLALINSNVITLAYHSNQLLTTANTTVATTAKDSDVSVVMQYFKVDSTTGFDGAVQLSSVTLQDLGTDVDPITSVAATAVSIYMSPTESPTLPTDAVLVGKVTNINQSVQTINFDDNLDPNSGQGAARTVFAGTSKYVYVVYSMYYRDNPDYYNTPNVYSQSKVTAVGVTTPSIGVTGLTTYLSNQVQLSRGTWSKITNCGSCHETTNIIDNPGGRVVTSDNFGRYPGSHHKHTVDLAYDCTTCHVKPTVFNHAYGFINFSGQLHGDKYSKSGQNGDPTNRKKVSNTTDLGTCTVMCHGSASSPQWGSGSLPTDCSGCHGNKQSGATATTLSGLHDRHMNSTNNSGLGTNSLNCKDCHLYTVNTFNNYSVSGKSYHINGVVDYAGANAGSYISTTKTCSNVYCHSAGLASSNIFANPAVAWSNGTARLACNGCHGTGGDATGSPNYASGAAGSATANSHSAHATAAVCNACHAATVDISGNLLGSGKHINNVKDLSFTGTTVYNSGAKTCSTVDCHGANSTSIVWGTVGGCNACHPLSKLSGAHGFHIYTSATYAPTSYNAVGAANGTLSTRTGYNFGCINCHPTTNANHKTLAYAAVATTQVDVAQGNSATYGLLRSQNGAGAAYNSTTKVCSANYCHSNGGTGSSGGAAITYYDSPAWNVTFTGDKCAMCHGNSPNSGGKAGSPAHYNASSWLGNDGVSGAHGLGIHASSLYAGSNATSYANGSLVAGSTTAASHGNAGTSTTFNCNICHASTMTTSANDHNLICAGCHNGTTAGLKNPGSDDMLLIANPAMHVNGTVEVSFAMTGYKSKAQVQDNNFMLYSTSWSRPAGYKVYGGASYDQAKVTPAPTYNSTDGSCSNIACHNNVRKATVIKWSDINGVTTCVSCHVPQ